MHRPPDPNDGGPDPSHASLSDANGLWMGPPLGDAVCKALLENLPQPLFAKNTDSVYVMCNDRCAQDLGITRESIVGKTDYDLCPKALARQVQSRRPASDRVGPTV